MKSSNYYNLPEGWIYTIQRDGSSILCIILALRHCFSYDIAFLIRASGNLTTAMQAWLVTCQNAFTPIGPLCFS